MIKYWHTYKQYVNNKLIGTHEDKSLNYWRDKIFSETLMFIVPLSFIALIPSVYISWQMSLYGILAMDTLVLVGFLSIMISNTLSIPVRKYIFILIIYMAATVLLYYMGSFGPSLLYLLTVTIFASLTLPAFYSKLTVWINIFICLIYAVALHLGFLPEIEDLAREDAMGWIGIASNLVLVSTLFMILIPRLYHGLQSQIEINRSLHQELLNEQHNLNASLKELHSKNSDLEQYAYTVSHDLQEPLRMITGFLNQLKNKYSENLDEKANMYIHYAMDGTKRMKNIIIDLLEFSRITRNNDPFVDVDINEIIKDVELLNKRLIMKNNAMISYSDLPVIYTNRTILMQIFQNLINNSLKYHHPERNLHIEIFSKEDNKMWRFDIRDNGIGISKEDLETVFIMFKRVGSTSVQGTGMGLALVKKAIENLKGDIWVDSTFGEGSTFSFTIPKSNQL